MVVETMRKEGLSYKEAERQFELPHMRAAAWERIYLEEGPEGLYIERRGRSSKGRPPKMLKPEVEEDLLAEVQRLRAENAYLKKLNALVAERVRQERKQSLTWIYDTNIQYFGHYPPSFPISIYRR